MNSNKSQSPDKSQFSNTPIDLIPENDDQVWYCNKLGHEGNQLNIVCKFQECPYKGLICASCLLKEHSSHFNQCLPVNDVLGKTLTSSRVLMQHQQLLSNQSLSQSQQIQQQQQQQSIFQQTSNSSISSIQNQQQQYVSSDTFKSLAQLHEIQSQNAEFVQQLNGLGDNIQKMFLKLQHLCLSRAEEIKILANKKEAYLKLEMGNIANRKELEEIIMAMAESDNNSSNNNDDDASSNNNNSNQHNKPNSVISEFLKKRQDFLVKLFSDVYQDILFNIDKNFKEAHRNIRISPNRYKQPLSCDNWGYSSSKLDAISFMQMCEETINFCGFTFYEITKWPDNPDNNSKVEIMVSIYEHEQDILREKFKETLVIQQGKTLFENKVCSLFFSKAVILNPKRLYAISLHSNCYITSYAGSYGEKQMDVFVFENSRLSSNGTEVTKGIFPSFIYF